VRGNMENGEKGVWEEVNQGRKETEDGEKDE
jgi:hypothetical protein